MGGIFSKIYIDGGKMDKYRLKKKIFIFNQYPEILEIEDSYLIIGSKEIFRTLDINQFDTVFTIYTLPIWIKHTLKQNHINIIHLNEEGKVEKAYLHKKFTPESLILHSDEKAIQLLEQKAHTIDRLFKTYGAKSLLNYLLKKGIIPPVINNHLNYILKSLLMDAFQLNCKLSNTKAVRISNLFFNLTDSVIPFSFYDASLKAGLNPEAGFLNTASPSLVRDLTEIPKLNFLKKLHHLIHTGFFENRDFSRKNLPYTTVKLLKILSNYFFYSNRFKRIKEILFKIEKFRRETFREIPCSL